MRGSAIRAFVRDRRGAVSILSAILLPVMIGVAALVIEFGGGLLTKTRLQRVADVAAFAAATAYNRVGTAASLTSAAQMIARLNSVPDNSITAAIVPSPKGDGSDVVQVKVTTTNRVLLGRVIGFKADLAVNATAYASVGPAVSPCVIALSASGGGLALSGGAALTATKCGVASNASIAVDCSSSLKAKNASYGTTAPSSCGSMTDPSGAKLSPRKTTTKDPLLGDPSVAAATGRLSTVSASTAPAAPSVPNGKDISFGYDPTSTKAQATAIGCTATQDSSTEWSLACPSGGTYNFGKLALGGGIKLKFNVSGTAATKYNFSGAVAASAANTIDFGPGAYAFGKGLSVEGGSRLTFGAGTFNFGRGDAACDDGAFYSICNLGASIVFGGPSTFSLSSGVFISARAVMTFGAGTSNSYDIGPGTSGHAISASGGSTTFFADATSGAGLFRLTGNLNMLQGGGTCMTLPAAPQHDINGFFGSMGGVTLGAGAYTVTGYIAFGANGGGDVTCNGRTVGVSGAGVTLVMGGASSYDGTGFCQAKSFCVGSGYKTIVLTAPATGATANLVVVGPTGGATAGAAFSGGSSTTLSGALYFPKGPIALSGGGSLGEGGAACLQIIGSEITSSGGTAATSTCVGASVGSAPVGLIQ